MFLLGKTQKKHPGTSHPWYQTRLLHPISLGIQLTYQGKIKSNHSSGTFLRLALVLVVQQVDWPKEKLTPLIANSSLYGKWQTWSTSGKKCQLTKN